jgi:hypothetical protein
MMDGFWPAIAASFVSMAILIVILLALLYIVSRVQLRRDVQRWKASRCLRCQDEPSLPGRAYCLRCWLELDLAEIRL